MEEFQATLSTVEKKLCARLELMIVVGKMHKSVPVLLTPDVLSALNLLVKHRSSVGIPVANPYLFARAYGGSLLHIQAWDALRKVAHSAGLENPSCIQSTKLRKYIATVTQVFSLESGEIDWLARHLGHDIRTHRQYYRLHESTVELAKISKLLIAVDNGDLQQWRGRSLENIDLSADMILDNDASDNDGESDCEDGSTSADRGMFCTTM